MIISLILLFHLIGLLGTVSSALILLAVASTLIAADFMFGLLFLAAANGILALLLAGGLLIEGDSVLGYPIGWLMLLCVLFMDAALFLPIPFIWLRARKDLEREPPLSSVGRKAIITEWDGLQGSVIIDKQEWKALSRRPLDARRGDTVLVQEIDNRFIILKSTGA